jgi:hypothetical protein
MRPDNPNFEPAPGKVEHPTPVAEVPAETPSPILQVSYDSAEQPAEPPKNYHMSIDIIHLPSGGWLDLLVKEIRTAIVNTGGDCVILTEEVPDVDTTEPTGS